MILGFLFIFHLSINTWLNNIGIILEIMGFVLILKATGRMKQSGGSFTSGYDYLENVMSITRPWFYNTGIILVIIGLAIQIVPSFFGAS